MSAKKHKAAKAYELPKLLHQTAMEQAFRWIVAAYVFLMLCIFPLYFDTGEHGKYFNMGATKYAFFKWVTIVGLLSMLLAYIGYFFSFRQNRKVRERLMTFSSADMFAAAFLAVSMLSYIFSSYKGLALWGYRGWFMGVISQIFFVGIFFFVSRGWNWSPFTLITMTVSAAICYQIGILQRFCFDPMGMYQRVSTEDIEKFLSTIGQTSWYSSYAVLILPFGIFFYWTAEQRWTRILAGLFVALGFGMICTTNSDSAYVAVVLIMMVFFRYSLESNEKMRRFLETVVIALASFRVIGWMHRLYPERQRTYITGDEKITKFITLSPVMLIVLVGFIGLYVVFRIATSGDEQKGKGAKAKGALFHIEDHREWIWRWTVRLAILVIWAVLMLVLLVTNGKAGIGDETSFFYFGESWGNHRGFNWRMAARALSRASVKDLLIGVGPDCFDGAMDTYCAAEVSVYWHGLSLACAHNEWLNMLVTEGVLGVAAYLGIFLAVFRRAIKAVKEEPVLVAFMAAVVAYIGHNIFCYQQCVCTPIIFIFMGIIEMICRSVRFEPNVK